VIYGKLTVHDRQTDEVHVEITRKGLAHARPNYCYFSKLFGY